MTNTQIEWTAAAFIATVLLLAFVKFVIERSGQNPGTKQPAGDDLDEHDFINQEKPFYHE